MAAQFRVSKARTRKRQVRLQDPVDWQLLVEALDATGMRTGAVWPEDPLEILLWAMLGRLRGPRQVQAAARRLTAAAGSWQQLAQEGARPRIHREVRLGEAEVGTLVTVLRAVARRFGSLTLAPVADLGDAEALRRLTTLPGVDWPEACMTLLRGFDRRVVPPTAEVRRVLVRLGALSARLSVAQIPVALERMPITVSLESLVDGLTALAEKVCTEGEPNCAACPVRKLCAMGRSGLALEGASTGLTFVDLFSGAGGMSLGLGAAGLRPILAVDVEEWACETYRLNHPVLPADRVLARDLRKMAPDEAVRLLNELRPDLIVGGPPCQGFSLIGKRGRSSTRFVDDPRNRLYKEFVRWVAELRPRLVIMENVPGLYSCGEGAVRADIERHLQEVGYAVDDLIVDASCFGVPQRRQRVLFIGAAFADFGDHARGLSRRIRELLTARRERPVTLAQAIADLPPLEANEGREAVTPGGGRRPSRYALQMGARRSPVLYHHVARPVNLRDLLLYGRLRPGDTAKDAMQHNRARHLMVYRSDVFGDKYRRLTYGKPAPTIMSHLAKDGHMFIHPDPRQRRSLTVREAARIQSFPDDFIFQGPRTHQFTQVGNAVPPLLARAIGEAICQALSEVTG